MMTNKIRVAKVIFQYGIFMPSVVVSGWQLCTEVVSIVTLYLYKFLRDVNFTDDQNQDFHDFIFEYHLYHNLIIVFSRI